MGFHISKDNQIGANFEKQNHKNKLKIFRDLEILLLERKKFQLTPDLEESLLELADAEGVTIEEIKKEFLEYFKVDEGTLPGDLHKEYIELIFSEENIKAQMEQGKNFNEAVAALAVEVKREGLELDKDVINEVIEELRKKIKE